MMKDFEPNRKHSLSPLLSYQILESLMVSFMCLEKQWKVSISFVLLDVVFFGSRFFRVRNLY